MYIPFFKDFTCEFSTRPFSSNLDEYVTQSEKIDSVRHNRGVFNYDVGFYRVSHDTIFIQHPIYFDPFEVEQVIEYIYTVKADTLEYQCQRTTSGVRGWFSEWFNDPNELRRKFVFVRSSYKPDSMASFNKGEPRRYTRALKRKFCEE